MSRMSVTAETSHKPMAASCELGQSPTEDSLRHTVTAATSVARDVKTGTAPAIEAPPINASRRSV